MPRSPTTLTDEIGIALGNLADAARAPLTPTLRLGVTGLSRSGKTVFITALIHNLLTGGALPGFSALSEGRFIGARLAEYPEAAIPRFAYEDHLRALTGANPHWPESTRRISQLRLHLRFQSQRWMGSLTGPTTLNLDIIDYPGEWLLDLPLLTQSYAEWSSAAIARARRDGVVAAPFLAEIAAIDPLAEGTDAAATSLWQKFMAYAHTNLENQRPNSSFSPGRFLLPGDLEGSPALTFAPLPTPPGVIPSRSLHALLARRYEAYKSLVVKPFFREHFARLDRQIVLVDPLRAANAGPAALAELETALTDILACFRPGSDANPLSRLLNRRIDRILFAATKADHIHSSSHDRLDALLNRLVANASRRARFAGARTRSLALASLRATREGTINERGETLPVIIGTPEKGETLDGTTYDGSTEIALFPGDLPDIPDVLFEAPAELRFLRFNPPGKLRRTAEGAPILPHIRLDTALEYLLGDRLR